MSDEPREPSITAASKSSKAVLLVMVIAKARLACANQGVVCGAYAASMMLSWCTMSGSMPACSSACSSCQPDANCNSWAGCSVPLGVSLDTQIGIEPIAPALPFLPAMMWPAITKPPPTKVPTKMYKKLLTRVPCPCSISAMQALVVSLANSTGKSVMACTSASKSTCSQLCKACALFAEESPSKLDHLCMDKGAVKPMPTVRAQCAPMVCCICCKALCMCDRTKAGSG